MTQGWGDPFGGAPFGQSPDGPPIISAPHQPPQPRPPRRSKTVVMLAVFGGIATITVAALVIWAVLPDSSSTPAAGHATTSSTPSTTAAPALVKSAQLPGLLLSMDEVKRATYATSTAYTVTEKQQFNASEGVATQPDNCRSALFTGAGEVFANSGATATYSRSIVLPDPLTTTELGGVEERVVLYPNASAASKQAADIENLWHGCVGLLTETLNYGKNWIKYQVDPLTRSPQDPSIVVLSSIVTDTPRVPNFRNVRVIAAKNNVVVDVAAFGGNFGNGAQTITAEILARVGGLT
ncbi:sensor domain-containing protein [Mycolicibacterium brisbanense]|uniref:PknJ protein n=1 Tax=Mycolicibacterium brisbanense TaxID=146020 RepID=A0A100VZV3_9MYCO|nr:sensor domain-containing protein [Mycolicibacterium brisbanense]MCV7160577.1 sensor domain-containing protein [Mycolicibacterium brisbanense]GAS89032.1 PknJ protein [Mycolicibacterium brisbanense]